MKHFILIAVLVSTFITSFAQTVPFPPNPGNTNKLENWGYTNVGTNWDTSPFLPFIYNGLHMRIMPPNGVTYNSTTKVWTNATPGKTYPLILFFHGDGETGTDNNNQLDHGGLQHEQAIQSGAFPGFAFYPQAVTFDQAKTILEDIIKELPVDINRIYVHGLSGGGVKTWDFTNTYPTMVAAAFPMSALGVESSVLLYTPLRQSQGSLDTNPAPSASQAVVDWFNNNGGHLQYYLLAGVGHGTWDAMYALPDFFSWFLSHSKYEIQVRFNRNLICPGNPISVDMGFTAGFDSYQWRKDTVTISGQTSANLIATAYGSYTGRIKNRGVWSPWSAPVTVGVMQVTNTPPIVTNGLKSIVLPAPDGSTTTELMLPTGYASYSWKNSANTVVSTSQIFTAVPVGNYTASANAVNGCSTIPSPVFNVVSATAPNGPDAVNDFLGYATSVTQVTLGWADKPSPTYNETGFEVYRSSVSATGPFTLVAITAPDVTGYNDTNLTPNTTYYYEVRPVNANAAAPVSAVVSVLTQVDNIPPTAPGSLTVTGTTTSSASLSWTASTDNVGVFRYDVFRNGVKVLSTQSTTASVYNLAANQVYNFIVKARDMTGNSSTSSNQVTVVAANTGLQYNYYEAATTPTVLPNFTTLTPTATGQTPNVDISVRKRDTNIEMYWSGNINIPVAGNYTFGTSSDDGSALYIGGYATQFRVVNNDGAHGVVAVEGTKNFATAGSYPIVITWFQGGGGFAMTVYWKNTAAGVVSQTTIPNSAFSTVPPLGGNPPTPPTGLTATAAAFDKINLSWVDASNNESGFRIYRSLSNAGPFAPIATVAPNTTTYQDVSLTGATTYYYRVTAFGDFGESGLSSDVPRGLAWSYYEAVAMTSLTQLNSLSPAKKGTSAFYDITVRDRSENMAIDWVGKINITTAATYTFYASSDDGSTLSVDGVQVVSNDTDGAQKEKSGTKALTVGWHDIDVKWRKHISTSSRLTISYSRPGLGKTAITTSNSTPLFFGTEINAKTLATPPVPLTPTNVVATNPQPTTIALTWTDNATDETSYEILRSYKQNTSYVQYKSLPANSNSFQDPGLFSNGLYFYKVVAIGAGGSSTSAEVSLTTANNPPVLTPLQDVAVKFGTTLDLNLYSTDLDGDPLTLTVNGLPAFATLTDHHDGSGLIHFAPASSDLGTYPIVVTSTDNHSGASSSRFTLTVTDKVAPVILAITNPTVNEGQTTSLQIQATSDFGPNAITWSFAGMPSFAVPSTTGGQCSIAIAPGYIDAGLYPVNVTVTDNLNSTTKTFTITVVSVDPNTTVSINMENSTAAPAPWNNMTSVSASNLLDGNGVPTTTSVQLLTSSWLTFNQGATTGNNSGVFPDAVLQDYYYFGFNGGPTTVDVKVAGLDVTRSYYFNFLGSSTFSGQGDNGSTIYKIGSTAVSLRVQNNKYNTATINSVSPNPDGTITFTMSKAAGAPVGYLNGFTYKSVYQDGTVPAAARSVQAAFNNNGVNVSWIDAPFNEDGYNIFRSTSATGPFVKMDSTPVAMNGTSYLDTTVVTGTAYYYEVQAFNSFGVSAFSNIASTTTPLLPPKITVTGNTVVLPNAFGMVSILTTPDASLTITNVPSFGFLSPNGTSEADIVLLPGTADAGTYPITATAVNAQGLITTQIINVSVNVPAIFRVYVNFDGSTGALTPWNNTNKTVPAAGDTYANLLNDQGANSGVTMTLQSAFGGYYNQGGQTGNNSGVVPDAVLKDYYYFGIFGSSGDQYIQLSGLNPGYKYRFKFAASSTFTNNGTIADNGSTVFTIGAQSASVNVQNNTTQLAVVDNVTTNNVGQVVIHLTKGPNTSVGYINGMIVEAYPVDPNLFAPNGLVAAGSSKTQVTLTWNDNSPIETGYEIQRSLTGVAGSYSVLTTTGPDISTYTDNVPAGNKLYYYQVRANTASGPSAFTNVAVSGPVSFKVYVNIDGLAQYDAPAPWNNLSRFGFTGDIFTGFRDDTGLNTGIRMRVQTQVESFNDFGATTSHNTGVFPDNVLLSFWYNDAYFPKGVYIMDGLDQTFNYNFGFLGSISTTSVVNTDYTINGVTTTNRNDNNSTTVSYIRNVKPDVNGEILYTVQETAGSPYSIFNALVIEGFPSGTAVPNGRVATSSISQVQGNLKEVRYGEATDVTSIYPNPVIREMNVKIDDASIGQVGYTFFDLMGREVQRGQVTNDVIDANFTIDVDLPPAIYLIRLVYPNGKVEARKFVKN